MELSKNKYKTMSAFDEFGNIILTKNARININVDVVHFTNYAMEKLKKEHDLEYLFKKGV